MVYAKRKMDFLLSFRSFRDPVPVIDSKPLRNQYSNINRTALTNFLFLTVENDAWKILQIAGVVFKYIITTYTFTFGESENIFKFETANIVLDLFYFTDFLSAFIYRCMWPNEKTPTKKLRLQFSQLAWRNAMYNPRKLWMLVLDISSLIPFKLFRVIDYETGIIHIMAHYIPTLRVYRFFVFYFENIKSITWRGTIMLELILKFGALWLVISHTFTCVYYFYVRTTHTSFWNSTAKAISFDKSNSFDWYLLIFYANQFSMGNIGFGDIPSASDGERLLTTIITLVGFSLLNGYLISALSNALGEKVRRVTNMRWRISLMKAELEKRRVPEEVIAKLEKFYHSLWVSRNGVGSSIEMEVPLPDALWSRINCDIFLPALNALFSFYQSLLFRSCDEFTKRAFAQVMEIDLFMAGDVILKRNEINSRMFYIRKGTIEILSYQDDETQIVTYGAGSVFGQIALLLSVPARSEVHAATFCEIQSISRRNVFLMLQDYPHAKDIIFNAHKNLLLNTMADKFKKQGGDVTNSENVVSARLFYKFPLEASRISRNDICVVSVCPFIFEPNTVYMTIWNTLVTVIIVIIGFYYPYCATFERRYPKRVEPFLVLCDLVLIINIYLSFSTAYTKENVLFSSLRDIAISRLREFSTYIDVIAVLPIPYFLDDNSRAKPIVLCLRCLELYKINFFFRSAEFDLTVNIVGFLRLIKYILYFFLVDFTVGILYYLEACYHDPCISDSWYPNNNSSAQSSSPAWASMYIAILMISGTGYGDITPKNMKDVVFVIIFCLVGALLFIYLISEYSANLSLAGEPKREFIDLANRVNVFLIKNKMIPSVRIRVRQFLDLQWERNQGFEFTHDKSLFYDTPLHLLNEINQFTRSRGIQNMKLFKDIPNEALNSVLAISHRKVLPPHEVLIYAGEVCQSLFVIEEGFCEVTYGKDASVRKIVGAGHDICTVEVMLDLISLCNVRTLTHCSILKVSKDHLLGSLKTNPIAIKELEMFIQEFKNSQIVQDIKKTQPIRLHLVVRSSVKKSIFRFHLVRKTGGKEQWRNPFRRLGLCQWIRFVLVRATVLPYGKLLKIWELSRCVCAFFSALLFPLLPFFELQVPVLFIVGYILDGTAWLDLYFRAHVGYYNKLNVLVSHPLWTMGHYIKGSFVLDFISCFPFDRIMFRSVYDAEDNTLVTSPSISYLRMLRVLQIYRIPTTIYNLGQDVLSPPSLYRVLVMMIALTIVFLNFLTSVILVYCINYKVDKKGHYTMIVSEQFENHFKQIQENYNLSSSPFSIYFVHFYWIAETAVFLGFGDITADGNDDLMIYVIVLIILSYLFFSYTTLVVASFLSRIDINLTTYQKRMGHLIKFLKSENVEHLLGKHTINHFEFVWDKQKGIKNRTVIRNFNAALKQDTLLYFYENTLKNVGAFSRLEQTFFRILSSRVDEINFMSGAGIYKTGDLLSEVYIVHYGEVTLVGENEDETLLLGHSMVFGNLDNAWKSKATLSAVATKNVCLLSIKTTELFSLFGYILAWTEKNKEEEGEKLSQILKSSNVIENNKEKKLKEFKPTIPYLIHKFSWYILIFYVVLSLFSINEVSYNAAFQAYNIIFAFILIPIDILFLLKIIIGFSAGFIDDAGDLVTDYRLIRRRYLRTTGFYVDLFSVIPFEILALAFRKEDQLYVASLFRLTKFLRARNIHYFFNMNIDTLSVNMVLVKMTTVIVWTGTLLHQCTCLWYFFSCPRTKCPDSVTWQSILDGDFHNLYLNSCYFVTVVLTTTGFGDVVPHTMIEFFCVDLLDFVGFFYTAIFIGQIISTVQKHLLDKTNYEYSITALKTYLHVNDVPLETQNIVFQYIENLWWNECGQEIPELLKDAPPYLINEIKQSTYGHHINNNPVFVSCDEFFRKTLINELRRKVFFPGDIIVDEGVVTYKMALRQGFQTWGAQMNCKYPVNRTVYFVHSGLVESQDLNGKKSEEVYNENTFFGLKQGVFPKEPHVKTYIAITTCVILGLKLDHWEFLSEFYPNDVKHIKEQTKDNKWD